MAPKKEETILKTVESVKTLKLWCQEPIISFINIHLRLYVNETLLQSVLGKNHGW